MTPRSQPTPTGDEKASGVPGADFESVGRYLSRQRRLRGISLEELAELTKIPLRSLERLESGQFDGSSDGFVRGFVRTVAEGLGLDVDDTLTRMLTEVSVDERGNRQPGPVARRWIGLAVIATSLVLAFTVIRGVWLAATAEPEWPADARVYWRDPVRTLADATGAVPEEIPARPSTGPSEEAPVPRAVARVPGAPRP